MVGIRATHPAGEGLTSRPYQDSLGMDAVVVDLPPSHLVGERIAEISLWSDLTLQQGLVVPAAERLRVYRVAAARHAIVG